MVDHRIFFLNCNFLKYLAIIYGFVYFLAAPCSVWDLSSPTRNQTQAPCTGSTESSPLDHQGSLYHKTVNKVPCAIQEDLIVHSS